MKFIARDCDSPDPQASQKACDKVAANFAQITGHGLPCDCPCLGLPGFVEAMNQPITFCVGNPPSTIVFFGNTTSFWPSAVAQTPPLQSACGNFLGSSSVLLITPAQAEVCKDILRQKAAAAGVTCF